MELTCGNEEPRLREAKVPSFPKWGVTRSREQQFLILSSHVADHSVVASGILDLSKALNQGLSGLRDQEADRDTAGDSIIPNAPD